VPFGRVARIIVCMLAPLLIAPAVHAQQASPAEVVERLHRALIGAMREADRLGYRGRLERLEGVLDRTYDYSEMARVASGSHWKKFSPEERQRVTQAFADMSAATYASRFDDFSGEQFQTVGTRQAPDGGVLVQTKLVRPGAEDVKLDYLVKQTDEGWQVVDVFYMGGISEVANQRSQFLSVLKQGGPEQLVALLNQKAQQQAAR
jgi:phospholipid transport system substrate-binding protein